MNQSNKKFYIVVIIATIVLLPVVMYIAALVSKHMNSQELKLRDEILEEINVTHQYHKVFDIECLGIKESPGCDDQYIQPLVNTLTGEIGYKKAQGRVYMDRNVDFTIKYYAGVNSFCKVNVCDKETFVIQLSFFDNKKHLPDFDYQRFVDIDFSNRDEKMEKLFDGDVLKIKKVKDFLKYITTKTNDQA